MERSSVAAEAHHPLARRQGSKDLPEAAPFPFTRLGLASPAFSSRSSISDQGLTSSWAAEVPSSLHPRPSRASSIVSTRTGTSIGTCHEDARSVDIRLDGISFHINRDASKISVLEQSDLPPYSPPAPQYSNLRNEIEAPPVFVSPTSSSPRTPTGFTEDDENTPVTDEYLEPHTPSYMSQNAGRLSVETASLALVNADLRRFSEVSPTSHHRGSSFKPTTGSHEEPSVWRSPSFNPGPERISVIGKGRSVSDNNLPDSGIARSGSRDLNLNPRLRRRPGVRLPKIITGRFAGSSVDLGTPFDQDTSPSGQITHSAGPSFGCHDSKQPESPNFIGRDAFGKFPSPRSRKQPAADREASSRLPTIPGSQVLIVHDGPPEVEEGLPDTDAPPPMESENDISIHYTRLIRSIDRDHRRALHARDKELAVMRERLNEIDQVYRKELKSRDFIIDDLRKRLDALQQQMQSRIEKAQNEVEDLWEARWKDRDRHLMERMRRIELESQSHVERAVAERDEEWAAEWANRNKHLLERLREAERAAGQNLRRS